MHQLVPKDREANLRVRLRLLETAKTNRALRRAILQECSRNISFWTSLFVYQYNPREKQEPVQGPFICWDFQEVALEKLLWCVDNDEDVIIEKSRQMGASWMLVILFVWLWLFRRDATLEFISRDEALVTDVGNRASLYAKVHYILSYLPDWMMPRDWKKRKRSWWNSDKSSTIYGEASTRKAAVGATLTAMGIDEFSQIDEDYEVLHRTSDAVGCRIFNGTHLGLDTAFYELTQRVDMTKLVLHWSQHPKRKKGLYRVDEKGNVVVLDPTYLFPPGYRFVLDGSPVGGPYPGLRSPWYDRQCRRKGDARAIAMDLDIDPKGSTWQFFDPILIRRLQEENARQPSWEGDIRFDLESGEPLGLERAAGGPLKIWCNLDAQYRPHPAAYVCAADVSTGLGRSNSCLSGANAITGEKVLEYATPHEKPDIFATRCVAICKWFRDNGGQCARLDWEANGPGMMFGKRVLDLDYPAITYHGKGKPFTTKEAASYVPGWFSNTEEKRLLLEEYRVALTRRMFINRSYIALDECLAYGWNKKGSIGHSGEEMEDPSGAKANHGDRVIADALVAKLCSPGFRRTAGQKPVQELRPNNLEWRRRMAQKEEAANFV